MKLHPDGTLEGTPEELAAYMIKMKLLEPKGVNLPNGTVSGMVEGLTRAADALKRLDKRYPGEGTIYTTNVPSQAHYDPFEYHKLEAKAQCDANAAKCIK